MLNLVIDAMYMILVDPKVFSFVVKWVKVIFFGIQRGWGFLPPIFYAVFWQPFWKWQTFWKFWKCRIAPLMVTYHYSRHWQISTDRHFQNGRHNTTKIQHFPILSKFHMWVDYDVPNKFPTFKNFQRSPFSKWPPQYHTNSTLSDFNDISYVGRLWYPEFIPDIEKFLEWRPLEIFECRDIIIYPHMKCRWNWTMLNLCGIVAAILKMATGRNFSMSVINSGHHNLPTYQHCSISTSWIDSRHRKISTGLHFQNGRHNAAKIQHCSISKVAFK
jgi:hypothetical protein